MSEQRARDRAAGRDRRRRGVERPVRSEDPSLSPEANRLLTEELREVVGRDTVRVPEGTPDRAHEPHGGSPALATLAANRPVLLVTLLAAVVVGGIIALASHQWWVLVVAVGLHALGTMLVAAGVLQLTSETEHVAPEVAARLEAEGVTDPDRVLTELVEEFSGETEARGTPEIIDRGHNETPARPAEDPARAAVQQRTAMTPSASGSVPVGGHGGPMDALQWWVVLAVMVIALVAAIVAGGLMWVVPAIVLPVGGGWMALQARLGHDQDAGTRRPAGDRRQGAWKRIVPLVALVVGAVAVFVVIIGAVSGSLT